MVVTTYSKSVDQNSQQLEKAYRQYCLPWAERYGAKFNPLKFELIHFTTGEGKGISIDGNVIQPQKSIRVLGVHINKTLSHTAHTTHLNTKIPGQLAALQLVCGSTWGINIETTLRLYFQAIRPAIVYGAIAWYPFLNTRIKAFQDTLEKWQGKFLRAISGAYRATATTALEVELDVEPLDLYTQRLALASYQRQAVAQQQEIQAFQDRLVRRQTFNRRRGRPVTATVPWFRQVQALHKETLQRSKKTQLDLYRLYWKRRWQYGTKGRDTAKLRPSPTPRAARLYKHRKKWEASALIQLRTRKIGLNQFLYQQGVPDVLNPSCECQQEPETVDHFLLRCPRWGNQRKALLGNYAYRTGPTNQVMACILNSQVGSSKAIKFLVQTGRLQQFQAARRRENGNGGANWEGIVSSGEDEENGGGHKW